jgi:hypothetical protein
VRIPPLTLIVRLCIYTLDTLCPGIPRGDCCVDVEACGEVDVMTGTRGSGR